MMIDAEAGSVPARGRGEAAPTFDASQGSSQGPENEGIDLNQTLSLPR